ncbi:hypothetical protein ACA910_003534 [Epithemia clementina (nom. ined.)]
MTNKMAHDLIGLDGGFALGSCLAVIACQPKDDNNVDRYKWNWNSHFGMGTFLIIVVIVLIGHMATATSKLIGPSLVVIFRKICIVWNSPLKESVDWITIAVQANVFQSLLRTLKDAKAIAIVLQGSLIVLKPYAMY